MPRVDAQIFFGAVATVKHVSELEHRRSVAMDGPGREVEYLVERGQAVKSGHHAGDLRRLRLVLDLEEDDVFDDLRRC